MNEQVQLREIIERRKALVNQSWQQLAITRNIDSRTVEQNTVNMKQYQKVEK